jgi:YVTN family beta-propeller protein
VRRRRRLHQRAAVALALTLTMACGPEPEPELASASGGGAAGYRDLSRRARHATETDDRYLSPLQLLAARDGTTLYVVCEGTDEVLLVDLSSGGVTGRIQVGRQPFGLLLGLDNDELYVSHRWDDDVGVIDLQRLEMVARIPVGEDPHGMAVGARDGWIYVVNLGTDDVSIVDTAKRQEVRRIGAGNAPFGIAPAMDGRLFVSSQYPSPGAFRTPPVLELTVIDGKGGVVHERRELRNTVIGQGIAVDPRGRFAVTALELPKNLIPQTQVYQGWMVSFAVAFSEIAAGGRTALLPIDEPQQFFADPYDVAFTADGRYLFVSSSGVDIITVIDMEAAATALQWGAGGIGLDDDGIRRLARHLGASSDYVVARIPTGANPKGMTVSADGGRLYVACRLVDEVLVIDTEALSVVDTIDLGGPHQETRLRRGARLFHFASISFQQQMSCNTCHPENNVDGLVYDIAVDGGMGRNLVDNLSLRGLAETAPFKWTGKNPNLQRQEGPRAAQLFFRTHGFDAAQNEAIVAYIEAIPQRPNRHRLKQSTKTRAKASVLRLGKELFDREQDNLGRYIPVANRCVTCHPEPYGTDRRRHDVGSRAAHDRDGVFDTPHLINVYERPPFMHDGRCWSLEEIWTMHNPGDTHGATNDMTKDQLNALIEYIKTF